MFSFLSTLNPYLDVNVDILTQYFFPGRQTGLQFVDSCNEYQDEIRFK